MWRSRQLVIFVLAVLCSTAAVSLSTCRRDESNDPTGGSNAEPVAETPQANLLVFPESLYVEDASVNAFVRRAMDVCARGEYEPFRLLWSAREEPLHRDEFETGWQAVEEIRIRALEQVMLAADDPADDAGGIRPAYAVFAEVQLDPSLPAGQDEPARDVVLMIVSEHAEWRLGHAPKSVRAWIKQRIEPGSPPPDN